MKTVIIAGGKGTRIRSVSSDIPKPLIKIQGIPVLQREIVCLRDQGFTELFITVSHMADQIIEYFGDGKKFGVSISYYVEEQPLGNAGALFKLRSLLGDEDFLLINADSIFDINFNRFINFHKTKGGKATIFTHPNSHPYDSGVIVADADGRVLHWYSKEDIRPNWYSNRVNAGIHIINPSILDNSKIDSELIGKTIDGKIYKVDLDRHILKPLCGSGELFCYDSPEYVKDMGTPDRYETVCKEYSIGKVKARNLKNKQKAIFLDRDGTINRYVGFLRKIDQFELLPGVAESIRRINESCYLAIVVSNQPVIARGEVTECQLREIHNKMETLLGEKGAFVDAIYYCPHHPDRGYDGEITELKIECDCRKPKPGMLIKAAEDYNIDLSQSWMIGDSENDIMAGKAAGCKTALIGTGTFGQDVTVDSIFEWCDYIGFLN